MDPDIKEPPKLAEEGGTSSVSRELYWSELSVDQQIERMRQTVKRLQQNVTRLDDLTSQLMNHEHAVSGAVLVTPEYTRGPVGLGGGFRASEDRYF